MTDSDPATFGSKQMLVNAATALFPTDGVGGTAASVDGRFPAKGSYVAEGYTVVTVGAGGTLTVMKSDGTTTLCTIVVPATATAGQFFQIGGSNGYESSGEGISAKMSVGTGTLWFRRIG